MNAKRLPLVVSLFLVCMLWIILWWPIRPSRSLEFSEGDRRVAKLAVIRHALYRYCEEHNNFLPATLTNLVPDYFDTTDRSWFITNSPALGQSRSLSPSEALAILGDDGDYVYLGTNGLPADIILYDRAPILSDDRGDGYFVFLLTSRLTIEWWSTSAFRNRISMLPSGERGKAPLLRKP